MTAAAGQGRRGFRLPPLRSARHRSRRGALTAVLDGTPGETVPEPPFPPAESIPAMGHSLCWIAPRLHADLPGNRRVLVAAAYRRSYRTVNAAGGVPPDVTAHADRIAHFLEAYAPPGQKCYADSRLGPRLTAQVPEHTSDLRPAGYPVGRSCER